MFVHMFLCRLQCAIEGDITNVMLSLQSEVWMEVVHEMEQAVGMCGAAQDKQSFR